MDHTPDWMKVFVSEPPRDVPKYWTHAEVTATRLEDGSPWWCAAAMYNRRPEVGAGTAIAASRERAEAMALMALGERMLKAFPR